MLAKINQLIFANTGSHFVPIGSYRDARHVAGCLSDLCLRALRASVVSKMVDGTKFIRSDLH
jgi:hypothetical protein